MTADNPVEEFFPSEPEPTPESVSSASGEPPGADAELSSLLEEYDQQVALPAEPTGDDTGDNPFADAEQDEIEEILRQQAGQEPTQPQEPVQPGLSDTDLLKAWAAGVDRERLQAREQADLQNVLSMAANELSDLTGLPSDFGERFLMSEYVRDRAFKSAWDNRYRDDASLRHAERAVEKKFRSMRKSAKSQIDPLVSADVALVRQAMRDGSRASAPPKRATDFASLDDKQFADQVEKEFGYRPTL